MESLQSTTLLQEHLALGAKMAPFAGFNMQIQYQSLKEEALAVRNNAGVFDVGHMGEFLVEGEEAEKFVDSMVTNDILTAPVGKAIYSPLCNEDGKVIDDLIVYKLASNKILICVNASNIQKDWEWFRKYSTSYNCRLENISAQTSLLALQGPNSEQILRKLGLFSETDLNLGYYEVSEVSGLGKFTVLARTGYTGEDGFEIFCDHELVKKLWSSLLHHGATPCGLGARDVLRLEVCYPLYGHEINENLTPLDSGLTWTVKFSKNHFLGKEALSKYQPKYNLVKIILEKGIPRQGYPVEDVEGRRIGEITSGTLSVVLNKGIALALIDREAMKKKTDLLVDIRGKKHLVEIRKAAFVKGGHKS